MVACTYPQMPLKASMSRLIPCDGGNMAEKVVEKELRQYKQKVGTQITENKEMKAQDQIQAVRAGSEREVQRTEEFFYSN